jgi:hypothetical protein
MEKPDKIITSIRYIGNGTKEIVYSNVVHKPMVENKECINYLLSF